MSPNIGVNVREIEGRATPGIQAAPTSVAAFIIRSERGVPDEVARISNWSQFTKRFGGFFTDAAGKDTYGAYAIRGFFENGGSLAYVMRIVQVATEETSGNKATPPNYNSNEEANKRDDETANSNEEPGSKGEETRREEESHPNPISPENEAQVRVGIPASLVVEYNGEKYKITAGYRGREDPGEWGNKIKVTFKRIPIEGTTAFKVTVMYGIVTGEDGDPPVVETWERIVFDKGEEHDDPDPRKRLVFAPGAINNPLSGSEFIVITSLNGASERETDINLDNIKANVVSEFLSGGADDSPDEDAIAGLASEKLNLFDIYKFQLLCCPETSSLSWHSQAIDYCEGDQRDDCMLVGHLRKEVCGVDANHSGANGGVNIAVQEITEDQELGNLRKPKAYGALYFPWIYVSDEYGNPKAVPPTGHVMGVYARIERDRGIWKSPAGRDGGIRGALDVSYHLTDKDHTDLVNEAHVNAVRYIPGQGIIIDSARTLSTSDLWWYVSTRLLFNFVKSSLKDSLRWVVHEPNDQTLWKKVQYGSVEPFLMGLWRRGAFGSGAPEDVFLVKIDEENNTDEYIKQGRLNIDVYFYPSRPAETIVISVGQHEGGAASREL